MPFLVVPPQTLFCSFGSNTSRQLEPLPAIRTFGSVRLCVGDCILEMNADPLQPLLSLPFRKYVDLPLPSKVWGIGITTTASMPYYMSDGDMSARIYLYTY